MLIYRVLALSLSGLGLSLLGYLMEADALAPRGWEQSMTAVGLPVDLLLTVPAAVVTAVGVLLYAHLDRRDASGPRA
jgi:hypothetical protein